MRAHKKVNGSTISELLQVMVKANSIIGYTAYTINVLSRKHNKLGIQILQSITFHSNRHTSHVRINFNLYVPRMGVCCNYEKDKPQSESVCSLKIPHIFGRIHHIPDGTFSHNFPMVPYSHRKRSLNFAEI